jgi:hypothetical protein
MSSSRKHLGDKLLKNEVYTLTATPDEIIEPATDGIYNYYGYARPKTDIATKEWKVMRVRISDSQVRYANGEASYINAANAMTALTYS